MVRVTFVSKTGRSRKLLTRRTLLSKSRPHACAGLICGHIAVSNRLLNRLQWDTSTAGSSRKSEAQLSL